MIILSLSNQVLVLVLLIDISLTRYSILILFNYLKIKRNSETEEIYSFSCPFLLSLSFLEQFSSV